MPKVKGRSAGYIFLHEWSIYLSRKGTGTGQSFRVGPDYSPGPGYYEFTAPNGIYSLFLDRPQVWGRPTVVPYVDLTGGGTVWQNVELPTDYSCAFGEKSGEWGDTHTPYATTWYQTFIATGTSITGASFKVAGTNASTITITIVYDDGTNKTVDQWPEVHHTDVGSGSLPRTRDDVAANADMWVRWRTGEVPTTESPVNRYALKLSAGNTFAPYCRTEDGYGYANGQAFDASGVGQNYDLYAIILCDNSPADQTVISYCNRQTDGGGDLAGSNDVWTQEILAKGVGLAGLSLWYGDGWDLSLLVKVRKGGPGGDELWPSKGARGASDGGSSGYCGASFLPGEIPLTPGEKYYIEASRPATFNPRKFTISENHYAYGTAFRRIPVNRHYEYEEQPDTHLYMQVLEYAVGAQLPLIEATPTDPDSFSPGTMPGSSPDPDTFTVRNSGLGTLNYTISDDVSWLSVSPASGTSNGEPNTHTIIYSTASLTPGTYTGTITVAWSGAGARALNTPQRIPITLTVITPGPPIIELDPSTMTINIEPGNDVEAQTFTVRNTGGQTLTYTISEDCTWLSVDPLSGSAIPGQANVHTISFTTASLAVGKYTCPITVEGNADNSPQTLSVTLFVRVAEDLDGDFDVDLDDFNVFQSCFAGPNRPKAAACLEGARNADFDGDGDVDLDDFQMFQACFNGPNRAPACR